MKYIKTRETFNVNQPTNEGFGLALIAGVFGAIFAPGIYREAKNFWSKNVIGSKYKETGNVEKVICQFDPETISPAVKSFFFNRSKIFLLVGSLNALNTSFIIQIYEYI